MKSNESFAEEIVSMWAKESSPDFLYFERFDREEATDPFWREGSLFRTAFGTLDTARTLEIACGTGRHSARFVHDTQELYLLDTSADALKVAERRFAGQANVRMLWSQDGETILLPDGRLTAVFSYDAMVHFEATTIANYLLETSRVLSVGGRALFHHSVYDQNPTGRFHENPGWRNFMNKQLFAYLVSRSGMQIVQYTEFNERNGAGPIDGLTLMEKPAR